MEQLLNVVLNFPAELWVWSFVTILIIHIFYYLFKISWPEMYFAVSDSMSLYISFSPVRYFVFRIVPIFIAIAILLGATESFVTIIQRIYAGLFIGITHLIFTNFKALLKLVLNNKSIHLYLNKSFQVFTHIITILLIMVMSAVAGAISSWNKFQLITPDLAEIRDNIWSSMITAMLAVWFYKLLQRRDVSSNDLFNKQKENLDNKIFNIIETESRKYNANEKLVKAICIVENIQRPAWIRKLERIKSFINKEGTYGIMQIKSSHYVTDEESIKMAIEKFFKNTSHKEWEELKDIVSEYNSDERYIEFVEHAFGYF